MAKEKHKKTETRRQDPNQELQEKYLELQLLKQQVASYIEQKQAVDEKESEINGTIEALKKLASVKNGEEMWSMIGSSTFVRSDIKDTEKVLVAVGAGVVTKETTQRAIEILEARVKDLEAISNEIIRQATAMFERINELEPQVEKLAEMIKE